MSLADELLNDLDGLSDEEDELPSTSSSAGPSSSTGAGPSTSSAPGQGLMLPPSTLPMKRKALEDSLDSSASSKKGKGKDESGASNEDGDEDDDMEGDGLLPVPAGGVRPTEELDRDVVEAMDLGGVDDVRKVAKLLGGRRLEEVLRVSCSLPQDEQRMELKLMSLLVVVRHQDITHYSSNPTASDLSGPVEENPEYVLIVSANNISVDVENELLIVHKVQPLDLLCSPPP